MPARTGLRFAKRQIFHSLSRLRNRYSDERMIPWLPALLGVMAIAAVSRTQAGTNANPLTYLDDSGDPFYVGTDSPRLTTPQWVGEPGIEAVVILAIDDMREPQKYEAFLRPILNRLKQIDGRAPVSIFCNQLETQDPQLQTWLKEGLSFEVHTLTHPCPLLANGNFLAAATNYHDGVDLLHRIPGSLPVAFRMPCCDSMNRKVSEVFSRSHECRHPAQLEMVRHHD